MCAMYVSYISSFQLFNFSKVILLHVSLLNLTLWNENFLLDLHEHITESASKDNKEIIINAQLDGLMLIYSLI